MHEKRSEVIVDPEILSGAPVFKGTRVPTQNLIDYLKAGKSVDDFLEGFPTVKRDQVVRVFNQVQDLLVEAA